MEPKWKHAAGKLTPLWICVRGDSKTGKKGVHPKDFFCEEDQVIKHCKSNKHHEKHSKRRRSKRRRTVNEAAAHLLGCIACVPKPKIRCRASGMISCKLIQRCCISGKTWSRADAHCHLGGKDSSVLSAPVLVASEAVEGVMDSAAEAEVAAVHLNAEEAVLSRTLF